MAGNWNGTIYNGDDTDEVVTGTDADEQVYAGLGNDVIRGGGGGDFIDGGLDSDKIFGGDGQDVLYDVNSFTVGHTGLIGKDQIFGGNGDDVVWFNSVDTHDVADGGNGTDTLVIRFDFLGSTTDLPVQFALGQTTICYVDGIKGLSASNFERVDVSGSNGDDILTGGNLGDTLSGGGGKDYLSGLGGDDLIDTGTGNFTALGGGGTDTLVLDLSDDPNGVRLKLDGHFTLATAQTTGSADGFEIFSVLTGAGDDHLTGGALNDSLNGGDGADVLYGGDGDDLLTLGQGSGEAYGGDGNDHIAYSNPFFASVADPGDRAVGGAGNDRIEFALGGNNSGYGGTGDDNISARYDPSTYGTVNMLYGGDGNDGLQGGNGADHIFGGAGNDVLGAFTRVQEVRGGAGNDTVIINGVTSDPVAVGQTLDGGNGIDRLNWTGMIGGTVELTTGDYTTATGSHWTGFEAFGLYAGMLSDTDITFGAGDDRIESGGAFHLTAHGGDGNDSLISRSTTRADLFGEDGNDHLTSYYGGGSRLVGGDGNDILAIFDIGSSTLDGGAGTDIAGFNSSVIASLLSGTAVRGDRTDALKGIEGLTGSGGDDTLIGDAADNQLFGGGGGNDLITTGAGSDTVLTYLFQYGTTHVSDFSHAKDSIGLSGFNGSLGLPNGLLNADRLVFGSFATAPTATIEGPQFFYDQATGNLWQDRDGTGTSSAAVLVLVMDNHAALDITDFVVGDYFFR